MSFLKKIFTKKNLLAASLVLNLLGGSGLVPPVLAQPIAAVLGALGGQ